MTENINIKKLDHSTPVTNKDISTLVDDIYALFANDSTWTPDPSHIRQFGMDLGNFIARRASDVRGSPTLRLSNLGTPCERKLWYTINTPDDGESLRPATRIKFLFGDILEALLLFLAKEAGHTVTGEQDEVTVNGVVGHRDAIIDGRLVDVKSASTYSYRKFQDNGLRGDDPFGYLSQLGSYLAASSGDDRVRDRDVASFLVIDKTLGNITLDTYAFGDVDYRTMVDEKREMLSLPEPPPRTYDDEPEGKSGNRSLCGQCSYCPFKHKCWEGVRTFIYSNGPTYLTKVERTPRVPEIDKDGNLIEVQY